MSYSGDPSASNLDMTRFLLGDTDLSDELVTDAEITAMLTVNSDDTYAAAMACANSLAAKYARKADRTVGDLSIKFSQIAKNFRDLAQQLESQGATSSAGFTPYAGGISISDKQSQDDDTNRVEPGFRRDLHNVRSSHQRDDGYPL